MKLHHGCGFEGLQRPSCNHSFTKTVCIAVALLQAQIKRINMQDRPSCLIVHSRFASVANGMFELRV